LVALAVSSNPQDVIGIIDRCGEICAGIIASWDGVVANSLGDQIIALFGYPANHEDHAARAVHSGLDLARDISSLSSPSGQPFQTRIAVATGSAVIAENLVVGEAIVMANQCRNVRSPNSVNVTASTCKLLRNDLLCDDPRLCEVEGVSEPVIRVTQKRGN
jgi:class 3 adenylate cyclase